MLRREHDLEVVDVHDSVGARAEPQLAAGLRDDRVAGAFCDRDHRVASACERDRHGARDDGAVRLGGDRGGERGDGCGGGGRCR